MAETLTLEYAQKHKTKSQSRGWKFVCPSCGGNDCWYTPDNQRAFCFECGSTYRVGEQTQDYFDAGLDEGKIVFDVQRIRELYDEAHLYYKENLNKEHREYLAERGIDSAAIDTFRIGYCPPGRLPFYADPIAKDAGLFDFRGDPALADRVVFPYIAENHVTDMRGRAIQNIEPKYRSLAHKSYQRGAIYPFNYARAMEAAREQKLVIITEGEIKAIVADLHGFPCVGLPGMLAWKPGFILMPDVRVVVVFDSNRDPADRLRVDRALANLARRVPSFDVVSLPLLDQDKMDIDYYLLHNRGGYNRFKYLVDNAVPYGLYQRLRRF